MHAGGARITPLERPDSPQIACAAAIRTAALIVSGLSWLATRKQAKAAEHANQIAAEANQLVRDVQTEQNHQPANNAKEKIVLVLELHCDVLYVFWKRERCKGPGRYKTGYGMQSFKGK